MASPDYQPIFKVKYNPVRGLAALLQGYNTGAQQKFVNNNVDRNAPIGVNERERVGMEQTAKMQALMEAMNPAQGLGLTPFPGQAQTPVAPMNTNISPVVQGPQQQIDPDLLEMILAAQKKGLKIGVIQ